MNPSCSCRSGHRRLALSMPAQDSEDLQYAIRSFDWEAVEDGVLLVDIGPDQRFSSLAQLSHYFRALEPEIHAHIDAAWINGGCRGEALAELDFRPLAELAPRLETPLLDILENGGIQTFYQSIFRCDSLDLWGYECLMRAESPAGELLPPPVLLDWARRENLTFMLDRACRETHVCNAARVDTGEQLHFLINFLPTAIYEPAVCLRSTFNAARRCGIAPEQVTFEVVETEEVQDASKLRSILDAYRDAGFGAALDDLGSGHSGLLLLADLEPDLLKIDRELVARSHESSIHRAICEAIVSVAHKEGKQVLAEGLEIPEHFAVMRELGVDLLQGFLLGKPDPEPAREPLYRP